MRQVVEFHRAIKKRNTTEKYYELAFHAKLHRAEMAPLEDILDVGSEKKVFSSKEEEAFEARAQQLLREQKAMKNV